MEGYLKKAGEELIKKLNLFKIVQVIFVIELYYLAFNSLLNLLIKINIFIPVEICKYNTMILDYFQKYKGFVGLLAFGLFIYGLTFKLLNFTPILKNYEVILIYGDSGIFIGLWLILIYITYKAYLFLNVWFIIYIPLLCITLNTIKKILKYTSDNVEWVDIPKIDS